MSRIEENILALRAEIGEVDLIAVSKTRTVDEIAEAIRAGQRLFGENKVQEAEAKFPALKVRHPDIKLHLIGALQTNKALGAVELFDVIQTLDRPSLAQSIANAIQKTGRSPALYIQVNIGNEPQKSGVSAEACEDFLNLCRGKYELKITGLMCIPPKDKDPTIFFKRMKSLTTDLSLPSLSMGMSEDFRSAIACGASEVRLGTAIFGRRPAL